MSGQFTQGFTDNQKPSSKVLRPPGGGCSDIFGTDSQATPRTVRNHMSSNIFGSTQNSPVKNSGDNSRRMGKDGDSYNRLFGNTDRPFTPAKNHMKSSIPLGGEPVKTANGNAPTNGHSNGKIENNNAAGQQNGVSKTEVEASPKDPGSGDSNQAQSTQNQEATSKTPIDGSNNNASNIDNNSSANENPQSNVKEQSEFNPNDSGASENNDNLSITANANINVTDNVDGANVVVSSKHVNETSLINGTAANGAIEKSNKDEDRSSTTNSSIASPMSGVSCDSIDASNKSTISSGSSLRSPRAGSRNPVTGFGIEMPSYKRNRVLRRDGNPVTGEGYNGAGGAEVNTTVPSLNGAKQVINKNRIPPGGYSSGLW